MIQLSKHLSSSYFKAIDHTPVFYVPEQNSPKCRKYTWFLEPHHGFNSPKSLRLLAKRNIVWAGVQSHSFLSWCLLLLSGPFRHPWLHLLSPALLSFLLWNPSTLSDVHTHPTEKYLIRLGSYMIVINCQNYLVVLNLSKLPQSNRS